MRLFIDIVTKIVEVDVDGTDAEILKTIDLKLVSIVSKHVKAELEKTSLLEKVELITILERYEVRDANDLWCRYEGNFKKYISRLAEDMLFNYIYFKQKKRISQDPTEINFR